MPIQTVKDLFIQMLVGSILVYPLSFWLLTRGWKMASRMGSLYGFFVLALSLIVTGVSLLPALILAPGWPEEIHPSPLFAIYSSVYLGILVLLLCGSVFFARERYHEHKAPMKSEPNS